MNTDHLLCRAKRIDNEERVVGYYVLFFYDYEYAISRSEDTIYSEDYLHHPVISSTIQKCTGWRDKNGRLVFEGMYFCDEKIILKITWDNHFGTFFPVDWKGNDNWADESFGWSDIWKFSSEYISKLEVFDNMRITEDGTGELYND